MVIATILSGVQNFKLADSNGGHGSPTLEWNMAFDLQYER